MESLQNAGLDEWDLQSLIGGSSDINVQEWQSTTQLSGTENSVEASKALAWFFEIVDKKIINKKNKKTKKIKIEKK